MAKYVRQAPETVHCGPMAIVNALKWAGVKFKARPAITYLEFACRTYSEDEDGTLDSDLDRMLRYVAPKAKFQVRRPRKLSVQNLRAHLRTGGAAVVGYLNGRGGGHYTILVGACGRQFLTANDEPARRRQTMGTRRSATVYKWLRRPGTSIWLLRKVGDNKADVKAPKARGSAQTGAFSLPATLTRAA